MEALAGLLILLLLGAGGGGGDAPIDTDEGEDTTDDMGQDTMPIEDMMMDMGDDTMDDMGDDTMTMMPDIIFDDDPEADGVADPMEDDGVVVGTSAADMISGGLLGEEAEDDMTNPDDQIFAAQGDDTVMGGAGSDLIFGQSGNDQLDGGSDNDVLIGDNLSEDDLLEALNVLDGPRGFPMDDNYVGEDDDPWAEDGAPEFMIQPAEPMRIDEEPMPGLPIDGLFEGDEELEAFIEALPETPFGDNEDAGDDTLNGGAGSDLIFGGPGDDIIDGGEDSDLLFGGSGNDMIFGGSNTVSVDDEYMEGNEAYIVEEQDSAPIQLGDTPEILVGGDGNDTLDGGTGNDLLFGGRGVDVFEFEDGDGQDTIVDFGIPDAVFDMPNLHGGMMLEVPFVQPAVIAPQEIVTDMHDEGGMEEMMMDGDEVILINGVDGMNAPQIDLMNSTPNQTIVNYGDGDSIQISGLDPELLVITPPAMDGDPYVLTVRTFLGIPPL